MTSKAQIRHQTSCNCRMHEAFTHDTPDKRTTKTVCHSKEKPHLSNGLPLLCSESSLCAVHLKILWAQSQDCLPLRRHTGRQSSNADPSARYAKTTHPSHSSVIIVLTALYWVCFAAERSKTTPRPAHPEPSIRMLSTGRRDVPPADRNPSHGTTNDHAPSCTMETRSQTTFVELATAIELFHCVQRTFALTQNQPSTTCAFESRQLFRVISRTCERNRDFEATNSSTKQTTATAPLKRTISAHKTDH